MVRVLFEIMWWFNVVGFLALSGFMVRIAIENAYWKGFDQCLEWNVYEQEGGA